MGVIYKLPLTPQQIWNHKTYLRLRELWQLSLIGSSSDIAAIIAGNYYPVGGDGEGELNGVPSIADINSIVALNYVHHDVVIDEYGFDKVPSEDAISEIIAGIYIPQSGDVSVFEGELSSEDIEEIINGL